MKTKTDQDILSVIRNRRSVRRYLSRAVPAAAIRSVLEAGRWAPSGLNNQPWAFLVVTDRGKKERLAGLTKYAAVIRGAPVVILVFLDQERSYHREKDILAVGACIQNMLLQAQALRLGTCWLGEILNHRDEARELCALPLRYELMAAVTLGYPVRKTKGIRRPLPHMLLETAIMGETGEIDGS